MSRILSTLQPGESQFKKQPLRIGLIRRLKSEGTKRIFKMGKCIKRKKPLKKLSRSRRTEMQKYFALTTEFLLRPENHNCSICERRREAGENIRLNASSEVHHYASRNGRLLCYVPYFRSSCRSCREWPHANPKLAREYGLLAPASMWGVFPEGD